MAIIRGSLSVTALSPENVFVPIVSCDKNQALLLGYGNVGRTVDIDMVGIFDLCSGYKSQV